MKCAFGSGCPENIVKKWLTSAGLWGKPKKSDANRKKVIDFLGRSRHKALAWHYARQAPPYNPEVSMALARGSVVALRRSGSGSQGLVWRVEADTLVVIPISGTDGNGNRRHRAEVLVQDISDFVETGLTNPRPALRCHAIFRVPIAKLYSQKPTGTAPPSLMARVAVAVAREIASRQMEERFSFRGLREVLA